MNNKGQIWISAVLYMALGVIVLTIVLAAGVPMIQKMKDKNSFAQAKVVFASVNDNIMEVINEGPGSRRYLSPFEIKAGDFVVDETDSLVVWSMKTNAKLMEPSYFFTGTPTGVPEFREGALYIYARETNIVDEYITNLKLDYKDTAHLKLDSIFTGPFAGTYSLTIEHTGSYDPVDSLPEIKIKVMP
ncbi:MAG: hypothetical protein KJ955_05410 [Nanoarchaeota archaeon]|nr:hypothetical protein [Nanoarchaeota archaeon]